MATAVADLCDANFELVQAGRVRALPCELKLYGGAVSCGGPVATLKVFEDNSLVREELEKDGAGRVLVIDGGGSTRCALFGGNLGSLAARNNWKGVIIFGCVRDVVELKTASVDIRALGSTPVKSVKKGEGQRNVPVYFGGVRVSPGDWCYADLDGVVVSDVQLTWPKL